MSSKKGVRNRFLADPFSTIMSKGDLAPNLPWHPMCHHPSLMTYSLNTSVTGLSYYVRLGGTSRAGVEGGELQSREMGGESRLAGRPARRVCARSYQ